MEGWSYIECSECGQEAQTHLESGVTYCQDKIRCGFILFPKYFKPVETGFSNQFIDILPEPTRMIILKVDPISKQDFDAICDDNTPFEEFGIIFEALEKRFHYCFIKSREILGVPFKTGITWYDFGNGEDAENPGYFDPQLYQERIPLAGNFANHSSLYQNYIPTQWLYEDFEDALTAEVAAITPAITVEKPETSRVQAESSISDLDRIRAKMLAVLTPEEQAIFNQANGTT